MIDFKFGVKLAPLEVTHLRNMWHWRNDPAIWAWCRQNDLLTWEAHKAWFDRQTLDPKTRMYMICAGPKEVGVCGLTDIDLNNRRAEFSLYIGTEYQRKGSAKAALCTLLSHGFTNLGLRVIYGETFTDNPAAILFEALGMRLEGTRRDFYWKGGKYVSARLYSLLSDEWGTGVPFRAKKTFRVSSEPITCDIQMGEIAFTKEIEAQELG